MRRNEDQSDGVMQDKLLNFAPNKSRLVPSQVGNRIEF